MPRTKSTNVSYSWGNEKLFTKRKKNIEIVPDGIEDCIKVLEGIERREFENIFEMSACTIVVSEDLRLVTRKLIFSNVK